jgi:hypothetical protein
MTRRWQGVIVGMASVPMALLAGGPLYDSDGWWHLRTGELILRSGHVPSTDPFSWTAAGVHWQPNSWLADVALASLHDLGGLVALSVFKGAAIVVLAVAFYVVGRAAKAAVVASAVAALGAVAAIFLYVVERPQTFSFLLFTVAVPLVARALRGSRRDALLSVGLFALWANVHAVAVTGVAAAIAGAVGFAVDSRSWRRPAALAASWVAATLATPFGVGLYTHAAAVRSASQSIREWQSFDPGASPDRYVGWFVVVGLVALVITRRWRRLEVLLPVVLLVALTADAMRNGPLLVIVLMPEVALGLSRVALPRLEHRYLFVAALVAAWGVLCYALAPYAIDGAGDPRARDYPARVVAAIPTGCRLLNEYHLGGFVIWKRPDVPVSQDGRNDVYGTERLEAQNDVLHLRPSPTTARAWLDRHDVGCVLLYRTTPLAAALADEPGWRRVASAPSAVLFVRNGAA